MLMAAATAATPSGPPLRRRCRLLAFAAAVAVLAALLLGLERFPIFVPLRQFGWCVEMM
jgi:ferric-dicitrate binding protein FerR (iron transport regulator)